MILVLNLVKHLIKILIALLHVKLNMKFLWIIVKLKMKFLWMIVKLNMKFLCIIIQLKDFKSQQNKVIKLRTQNFILVFIISLLYVCSAVRKETNN